MRPLSDMPSFGLMFNHAGILFEVLSRMKDGWALKIEANDLAEATSPMNKKEKVAAGASD